MKYEKFEGSLGEFLEQYFKGITTFYVLNEEDYCRVWGNVLSTLVNVFEGGIYIEREEVWTDHLPALCWVSDYENDESEWCIRKVYCVNYNGCYETDTYDVWKYARPVTQAEIDMMIWKRGEQ